MAEANVTPGHDAGSLWLVSRICPDGCGGPPAGRDLPANGETSTAARSRDTRLVSWPDGDDSPFNT